MEERSNGLTQSTYKVIAFEGSQLPQKYFNFVLSKWLRTFRYGNFYVDLNDPRSYFDFYQKYLRSIINRPNTYIRIAVLSDDSDVALGWSAIEGDVLHYVYIQHINRGQGIAKSLVPSKINFITHLTKSGFRIWKAKLPNAKFDMFR